MDKVEIVVSVPTSLIEKIQDLDMAEKKGTLARQILKQIIDKGGHIDPKIRTLEKGRQSLNFTLPKELFNELKKHQGERLAAT